MIYAQRACINFEPPPHQHSFPPPKKKKSRFAPNFYNQGRKQSYPANLGWAKRAKQIYSTPWSSHGLVVHFLFLFFFVL